MRRGGRQGFGQDAAVFLGRQLVCLDGNVVHLHCDDNLEMQTNKLMWRPVKDRCVNTAGLLVCFILN